MTTPTTEPAFEPTHGGVTPNLNLPLYVDDDKPTWRGHVNYTNEQVDAGHARVMGRLGDYGVQIGDLDAAKIDEKRLYGYMSQPHAAYFSAESGNDGNTGTLPGRPFKSLSKLAALKAGEVAHIGAGEYSVSSNIVVSCDVTISPNAKITLNSGGKLDFRGMIVTNGTEIFSDNGGVVGLLTSRNTYNLAWFASGSNAINERWNFARRDMKTFGRKRILIPQALPNQPGTWTDPNGYRTYWVFNGPIEITDQQNTATWQIDGEFTARSNCDGFMLFNDAAKPENIYFYGDFNVIVPANVTVNYGIKSLGCARVLFFGMVVINGCATSMILGNESSNAPVGEIRFIQAQCSFFSVAAVQIYGRSTASAQNIQFDRITMSAAQLPNINGIEIRGLVRNLRFLDITYATDAPKDGYTANDIGNVVLLESNGEGTICKVRIDSIYTANANNAVKTTTSSVTPQTPSAILGLTIGKVWSKYNGAAASFDYCTETTLDGIENPGDVTIGSNATYTKLRGAYRSVIDSGLYTTVNNLARTSRGSGTPPNPGVNWPLGTMIFETGDQKLYTRIAKDGTAADFVKITP